MRRPAGFTMVELLTVVSVLTAVRFKIVNEMAGESSPWLGFECSSAANQRLSRSI